MKINGSSFREGILELAVQSAKPGESAQDTISRAEQYCAWVLPKQYWTTAIPAWHMSMVDFGPEPQEAGEQSAANGAKN